MQLQLATASREEIQKCWAFAKNELRKKDPKYSFITSCSPTARIMGIRRGMTLEDAHTVVPGIRVITYKGSAR